MNNYRVTFGGEDIDYKSNFADCRKYMPTVKKVVGWLNYMGHTAWWFFEPYVEITWLVDPKVNADSEMETVRQILRECGVEEWKEFTSEDGQFADWYGLTPEERESGTRRYEATSRLAQTFYDDEQIIEDGLGRERHYMRACHVLANQLGMNYEEESIALSKRASIADYFWTMEHADAVARYEKRYGEKYMGRDDD